MNFDFLSNPKYDIWAAFWVTVQLTFWAAIGSLVLGTVLATMRVCPVPLMRGFAAGYVNIVRNIPLTVIIIMMSQVLYSQLGLKLASRQPRVNPQGFLDTQNFRLAVLGLVLYTSTFVSDAIRSGINTVPPGQAEAARAIGMKFTQVLGIIVLPQAFRAVIAPLASVLIALTKNTTVASAIGVAEAALLMNTLVENESDKFTAVFLVIAFGFIALTLPIGLLLGWVAKRVAVHR
ncbi:amino acid ABC transporter membrane protein 1, PAAT family [Nakamurella panacisegetis]|uniref:Amino acid ABC transporter membrane protein 1, PAAT family n=1 Tax=Nakamurella panacisegetis TaxID=1090615 RepID=A0A1H0Q5C4_9ACTN|nr:amino acid ABC transporter permease [Nakamurella panacisegetis]SDP12245.1 amino acid ABC transporter membrane protein 1, PAAT family [Nakamurella panacisegetis]